MASLKKKQKRVVGKVMGVYWTKSTALPMPLLITFTRVGPRKLDDDNLQGACKYVRDCIADRIGTDDGSDQYTWRYEQRVGDNYSVEVEIIER